MGNAAQRIQYQTHLEAKPSTKPSAALDLEREAREENERIPAWERLLFSNPRASLGLGIAVIATCLCTMGYLVSRKLAAILHPEVANQVIAQPTIPSSAFGVIKSGGETLTAYGAVIRLINPQFLSVWGGSSAEPQRLMEFLFYKQQPSAAELSKLPFQGPLNTTSDASLLANPIMAIQVPFAHSAASCDKGLAKNGAVLVRNPGGTAKTYHAKEFSPVQAQLAGLFSIACGGLSTRSPITMTFKSSFAATMSSASTTWDVEIAKKPIEMLPVKTLHLNSFAEAYALVEPDEKRLSIGFFPSALTVEDQAAIGVKGALTAASVSPRAIMSMQLNKTDGAIDRRNIVNDYSLVLTPEAGSTKDLVQKAFFIESVGSGMKVLAGELKSGSSVTLGLSGRELFSAKTGLVEVNWALNGKAKLIYRGTGLPAKQ
jgi:hypothetical protein